AFFKVGCWGSRWGAPDVYAQAQQLISSSEVGGSVLQRQHLESEKPLTPLDFPEKGESESARREMEDIVRAGPNFEEATVEVYVTGLDREPLDLKEITKIELCAQKQCVPADLAGRVRGLPNEPMETAVLLGKNHMPAGTLTHVRLHAQSQQGSVVISEARLPEPLFLQYMVNRAKLLLVLQGGRSLSDGSRQEGRAMVRLGAVSATYEYDYPGAEYLFYNPLKGMKVRLSSGVNIDMPAGAFDKPVIFVFMVDDTGGVYPSLNMVPYYNLKKPLKLGVMPFSDYKARLTGRIGDPDSGKLAELVLKEMSVSVWNTEEVANLNFEGMLRGDGRGSWMKEGRLGDRQLLAQRVGLSSCLDFIKNDDFQEKMDFSLKASGMFYLPMACENIPPYVHLVVTDGWSSSGGLL
ncbi:MAG: hypothetical protein Q4B17_13490, partial [Lautropia sp.]|nr:hypothetical protein [Lautropia sp.]